MKLVLDASLLTVDDWIFLEDLVVAGWSLEMRAMRKAKELLVRIGGDEETIGKLTLNELMDTVASITVGTLDSAVNPPSGTDSASGENESVTEDQPGAES